MVTAQVQTHALATQVGTELFVTCVRTPVKDILLIELCLFASYQLYALRHAKMEETALHQVFVHVELIIMVVSANFRFAHQPVKMAATAFVQHR